jgi:hypothetical protein
MWWRRAFAAKVCQERHEAASPTAIHFENELSRPVRIGWEELWITRPDERGRATLKLVRPLH